MTKLGTARALFLAGDVKRAFKIVYSWRPSTIVSKSDLTVVRRGLDCLNYPNTYKQLGFDPEKCVEEAKALFSKLILKEE